MLEDPDLFADQKAPPEPARERCPRCGLRREHTDEECASWAAWHAVNRARLRSVFVAQDC